MKRRDGLKGVPKIMTQSGNAPRGSGGRRNAVLDVGLGTDPPGPCIIPLQRWYETRCVIATPQEVVAEKVHPQAVDQVVSVSKTLMSAAEEMQNLAETSFGGAEARQVLERIAGLGEEEWKADRMQRLLSIHIYEREKDLDPVTILFYEKMLITLGRIANDAENTGDLLRQMIVKG